MRQIKAQEITQAVAKLCQQANFELGDDMLQALKKAREKEESPLAKDILDKLIENAEIAREERLPLCQDCGTAVVFLEIGQDVHIAGGDLNAAITEGVRQGYSQSALFRPG
jgi:fumarate hydratase subunit alpha